MFSKRQLPAGTAVIVITGRKSAKFVSSVEVHNNSQKVLPFSNVQKADDVMGAYWPNNI